MKNDKLEFSDGLELETVWVAQVFRVLEFIINRDRKMAMELFSIADTPESRASPRLTRMLRSWLCGPYAEENGILLHDFSTVVNECLELGEHGLSLKTPFLEQSAAIKGWENSLKRVDAKSMYAPALHER